jgi:beta-ureidopropionase / N-carbamoyl-L-amino-acid hydrolase
VNGEQFLATWNDLLAVGQDASTGGYRRYAWNDADMTCREWFVAQCQARSLDVQPDRNGNLWAWWLPEGHSGEVTDAFVTGSHLDSVPDGGAFDGPLGVVSSLLAVDEVRARGVNIRRPVGVVLFADEEGARFGMSCVGSRLTTGALDADRARALTDRDGTTLAEAMRRVGVDPATLGRDEEAMARIGLFVELHVEQGRDLVHRDEAIGVAEAVWPHGRWRLDFTGEPNHAGTTRLIDRRDPVLTFAQTVLAARRIAADSDGLATLGRMTVEPGATNGIASHVAAWLDARAADTATMDRIVEQISLAAADAATADGTAVTVSTESSTPRVEFDHRIRTRLADLLGGVPVLPTGAGHDAAILSTDVDAAMIFVRNPTGVSHAPNEFAEPDDCAAGVDALATIMTDWVSR